MMLKRGTLLLMLSAIALGGAVLLFENRSVPRSAESPSGESAAENEKLFPFEEEEVEQFSVTRQQQADPEETDEEDISAEETDSELTAEEQSGDEEADNEETDNEETNDEATAQEQLIEETLSFVKSEEGTWQMIAPETSQAEGGAIAFLLSQVATPAAVPVVVDVDNLEEFGLAEPEATVSLLANGSEYLLHVGGLDFLRDKRYVQVMDTSASSADADDEQTSEATAETLKIYAISGSIINAVNRPTADWLLIDDTAVEDAAAEGDSAEQGPDSDKSDVDASSD